MPERSNGAVSKTVVPLRVPRVRIPPSPPVSALPVSARFGGLRRFVPRIAIEGPRTPDAVRSMLKAGADAFVADFAIFWRR